MANTFGQKKRGINMTTEERVDVMTDRELFDDAINMLESTLIYMAHVRRYYPKVHNKTVLTKKFLKHEEDTDG